MEALKELYCSEIKYNGLNNMKRMQLYNLKRNWSIKKRILNAILKLSGGCGRFLGPELSNSKTASILHRTQTP